MGAKFRPLNRFAISTVAGRSASSALSAGTAPSSMGIGHAAGTAATAATRPPSGMDRHPAGEHAVAHTESASTA